MDPQSAKQNTLTIGQTVRRFDCKTYQKYLICKSGQKMSCVPKVHLPSSRISKSQKQRNPTFGQTVRRHDCMINLRYEREHGPVTLWDDYQMRSSPSAGNPQSAKTHRPRPQTRLYDNTKIRKGVWTGQTVGRRPNAQFAIDRDPQSAKINDPDLRPDSPLVWTYDYLKS
jgi:hypothetical protein